MSKVNEKNTPKKRKPARNPEGRENQLINYAMNLAEQKLLDGTASSQLITTIINWASTKNRLELEKLKSDLKVSEAKVKYMESQESANELYERAIEAFKTYSGKKSKEEDDEIEYGEDY